MVRAAAVWLLTHLPFYGRAFLAGYDAGYDDGFPDGLQQATDAVMSAVLTSPDEGPENDTAVFAREALTAIDQLAGTVPAADVRTTLAPTWTDCPACGGVGRVRT